MALIDLDQHLIQRCLARDPDAWKDFVERFLGLVYHVVRHTAHVRHVALMPADHDDLAADCMEHILREDFRVLRHFRGKASLASYLAVVFRRVVVHKLPTLRMKRLPPDHEPVSPVPSPEASVMVRDEVERLLRRASRRERAILRGIFFENKSYRQLAVELGVSENSIGPTLSRLRTRLRRSLAD